MGSRLIRLLRRSAGLVWAVLLVSLLAVVAAVHIAPATGHSSLIIRGGSMEPAIPLGSVILISRVDPAKLATGDVVTVRGDNKVVYTHRVTRVLDTGSGISFETKGDANERPDPQLVPGRAVIGRVDVHIPIAGFVMALLATPGGAMTIVSLMASLLLAYLLLEDVGRRPKEPLPASTTPRPSFV